MPATVSLRLDTYSLAQLKLMRRIWPRVIAAQQSNIVRDAKNYASPVSSRRDFLREDNQPFRSFALPGTCAPTDVERLTELAELWQFISHRQRCELLELAQLVSGARV